MKFMVMSVKNMRFLVYGSFAVRGHRDAALKTEAVDIAKRGCSTRSGNARYWIQLRAIMCGLLLSHVLEKNPDF